MAAGRTTASAALRPLSASRHGKERCAGFTTSARWTRCSRSRQASGWRVVCKKGIRLDSVFYIAGPLGSLVGERVKLRRDPADRRPDSRLPRGRQLRLRGRKPGAHRR